VAWMGRMPRTVRWPRGRLPTARRAVVAAAAASDKSRGRIRRGGTRRGGGRAHVPWVGAVVDGGAWLGSLDGGIWLQ
jgi:hypothetical protein